MPFTLYVLRCADGSYYIGHTDDLEKRMDQHWIGAGCSYTAKRSRHPLELAWTCEFEDRLTALERELQIKGWTRAKKEALIAGEWARLKTLARGPNRS